MLTKAPPNPTTAALTTKATRVRANSLAAISKDTVTKVTVIKVQAIRVVTSTKAAAAAIANATPQSIIGVTAAAVTLAPTV